MLSNQEKLEVIIDKKDSSKYSVTVSWRGMKETSDFIPPYSQENLNDILREIGEIDDATGKPKASDEQLRDIGLNLYRSLFPSEALRNIATRCLAVSGDTADIDLRYNDSEIGKIPWELLSDGKIPLVASGKLNLVRVLEIHEPFEEIAVHSPLKMLVVVARPLDQPLLQRALPIDKLRDELKNHTARKKIVVHHLIPPTRDMLVKWLGKGYDIVQFYGHGGKGCLAFENELGLEQLVKADDLAVLLRGSGVQLVVLCACHSGETATQDMFTGVAQSLVGACVPAVLGWNFAVPVETALVFMEQFYAALTNKKKPSVRKAVAQARRALYSRGTAHFPMLFERVVDDRLVQEGSWSDEALKSPYEEPKNNFGEPLGIHNLLVGRFRDLRELSNTIASPEAVIALWGFSGVGKTALAVRGIYDRFLWRFPDGAWYVRLHGGKTFDTILSELCTHMEIPSRMTIGEKEHLVLDLLAQTRTLVLLDNFEDVETDQEITSFLNKVRGSSKILLTSRHEPRQLAWRRYELREMNPFDAVKVFLTIAERAGRRFSVLDLDIVSEICRRVDYFPIAIAYIAASMTGTLQDVINELSETPPDPVRTGFQYAYGKLSVNAQELLARLSIFKRPFRRNAVKAMAVPIEPELQLVDWKKCLSELRRTALLLFSQDLYHMLTMTRQLVSEHLREAKEWHSTAADHYLSSEGSNPFSAFDHLLSSERWREAVNTINSAMGLISYGLAGELAARLEEAAKVAAEKLQDPRLQSFCLGHLGSALADQGRYDKALMEYKEALRIQRSILESDPENFKYKSYVATTLTNLGGLQHGMGRHNDAIKSHREALKIFKNLCEAYPRNPLYTQGAVGILLGISYAYEEEDDLKQAVAAAQSIIDQSRFMQHAKGEARGFLRLAELRLAKKDNVKAEKSLAEVLRLAEENDFPDIKNEASVHQGEILLVREGIDASLNCFSKACINSLEQGSDIHNRIVNKVVGVLNRLGREGNIEAVDRIGKHLIETWKKQQLDEKVPQFIEYIEKIVSNLQP